MISTDRRTAHHRRRRRAPAVLASVLAGAVALLAGCVEYDFGYPAGVDPWGADMALAQFDGTWWIRGAAAPVPIGSPEAEGPGHTYAENAHVPGNYDGDAFWEPAVVRRTSGPGVATWSSDWVTGGTAGTLVHPAPPQGDTNTMDVVPVPADYDGDGATEPAWYRYSDASWWVMGAEPVSFGVPTDGPVMENPFFDQPVPADYDGDGDDDIAVFRITDRTWHTLEDGELAVDGGPGFFPVPGRYVPGSSYQPATVDFAPGPLLLDSARFYLPGRTVDIENPPGGYYPIVATADFDNDGIFDPSVTDERARWDVEYADGTTESVVLTHQGYAIQMPWVSRFNIVRLVFAARCLNGEPVPGLTCPPP